jgi:hypothetical protein
VSFWCSTLPDCWPSGCAGPKPVSPSSYRKIHTVYLRKYPRRLSVLFCSQFSSMRKRIRQKRIARTPLAPRNNANPATQSQPATQPTVRTLSFQADHHPTPWDSPPNPQVRPAVPRSILANRPFFEDSPPLGFLISTSAFTLASAFHRRVAPYAARWTFKSWAASGLVCRRRKVAPARSQWARFALVFKGLPT